jgi:hypothetical protein
MGFDSRSDLVLRSRARRGVSKDGHGHGARWFETRSFAALFTMRHAQSGLIRYSPFAKARSAVT